MDLDIIRKFVYDRLSGDKTGHALDHIERVEKNANRIMDSIEITEQERDIVIASVLLHDIADYKITNDIKKANEEIDNILTIGKVNKIEKEEIKYIIDNISFSKNIDSKKELSILGKIVQDADRLDAIGAIGIARTFYYGGSQGNSFYDENSPRSNNDLNEDSYKNSSTVINHFYEKLLKLENLMNTNYAKKEARKRTEFMELFLEEFYKEI